MTLSKLNENKYGTFDETDCEPAFREKLQSLEDRENSLEQVLKIYESLGQWVRVDDLHKQLVLVRSQMQSLKRKLHLQQEKLRIQQRLQEEYGDSKVVTVLKYDPNAKRRVIFNVTSKYVDTVAHPHVVLRTSMNLAR